MSFGHNKDNFVNLVRLLSAGIDPTAPHVLKIWRQASSKVAESNNVSVTSSASEFPDGQKIGTFTSKNGFFRNFLNLLELHLIESLQLRRNTIVAVHSCWKTGKLGRDLGFEHRIEVIAFFGSFGKTTSLVKQLY